MRSILRRLIRSMKATKHPILPDCPFLCRICASNWTVYYNRK